MPGSPQQDPQDELATRIEITPDLVALCGRLQAKASAQRMRALALMAEAYEAQVRRGDLSAAA